MNEAERREKLNKVIDGIQHKIKGNCFGGFSYYHCECYCWITIFFARNLGQVNMTISIENFIRGGVEELTHQAIIVIKNEILDYYFN